MESNGNASPKLRSSAVRSTASNSTNCSRNNSPRLKDLKEPRLRPGVSSRSSSRNSANLTSSTLQQDLMKLINPDDNVSCFYWNSIYCDYQLTEAGVQSLGIRKK